MNRKNFTTTTQRINTSKEITRRRDITLLEKAVAYALLAYHLNNRTGQCNPTVATLADEVGSHRTSIYKAIQGLQFKIGLRWENGNFIFELAPETCADDAPLPADDAPLPDDEPLPERGVRGSYKKAANRF
jgi:hypothetical protein